MTRQSALTEDENKCLGNYVLNEITHENALEHFRNETQSRKFNKFMSIIILNDSIILALMLFRLRLPDSENYESQSEELMGSEKAHETCGTWCDGDFYEEFSSKSCGWFVELWRSLLEITGKS